MPSWDEGARLAALYRYDILDTPQERDFDDIAQMAAEICGTPIAVVNLVADGRQWFKAEVGLGVRSTPLESSFCAHAILQPGLFVVPDTTQDPRFACNPLVTAENGIRFYAGALLEDAAGLPLGTVCVLDTKPHVLTGLQERTLTRLARQVMIQLELRLALREQVARDADARQAEARLRLALEAGGVGTFEVDVAADTILVSPEMFRLFGLSPDLPPTPAMFEACVVPEDRPLVSGAESRRSGSVLPDIEYRIRRADTGEERWVARRAELVRDAAERPLRMRGVVRDVTERRAAQETERLLALEMAHRVKNTLALVRAIASQTLRTAPSLAEGHATFERRLLALARASDLLVHRGWSGADVGGLVTEMAGLHGDRVAGEGPALQLNARAGVALAMALHELATNATKYGALSTETGRVTLDWQVMEAESGPRLHLRWREEGGPTVVAPTRKGFGSRLIEGALASACRGTVRLEYLLGGVLLTLDAPLAAVLEDEGLPDPG